MTPERFGKLQNRLSPAMQADISVGYKVQPHGAFPSVGEPGLTRQL